MLESTTLHSFTNTKRTNALKRYKIKSKMEWKSSRFVIFLHINYLLVFETSEMSRNSLISLNTNKTVQVNHVVHSDILKERNMQIRYYIYKRQRAS